MEEFLLKSIRSLDTSVEEENLRSNYATDIKVGQLKLVECDILPVQFKKEKAVCFFLTFGRTWKKKWAAVPSDITFLD